MAQLGISISCAKLLGQFFAGFRTDFATLKIKPAEAGFTAVSPVRLFQQGQHGLRLLVGLGQHGCSRLLDDLGFRQISRRRGVISIHDGAARRLHVGRNIGHVVSRVGQSIDGCTNSRTGAVDIVDSTVQCSYSSHRRGLRSDQGLASCDRARCSVVAGCEAKVAVASSCDRYR